MPLLNMLKRGVDRYSPPSTRLRRRVSISATRSSRRVFTRGKRVASAPSLLDTPHTVLKRADSRASLLAWVSQGDRQTLDRGSNGWARLHPHRPWGHRERPTVGTRPAKRRPWRHDGRESKRAIVSSNLSL